MAIARALLTSLSVLALTSCSPGEEGSEGRDSAPGLGYELAVAGEATQAGSEQAELQVIDLTVEQLRAKIDSGDIRLIDVRREDEVAQGVIPGAEHIALDSFDPEQLDLSDGREIVIYCRSGRRSRIAGERLAEFIGEPAQHLAGGINAWVEAGEPLGTL